MASHNLFIDIDRGEPVISSTESTIAALPAFTQQDTLSLRVRLLAGFSRISSYTPVATAGITLQAALGLKVGNSSTIYTQAFTWTAGGDLADPYFDGDLQMGTDEIGDLLGDGQFANAFFEVKTLSGGLPRTVLSKLVKVHAAVIKDGGMSALAQPTPLSAEAADATFLQRRIRCSAGNPIILVNGALEMAVYLDADGTFKTVLLS